MTAFPIEIVDPGSTEVREIVARHHAFANLHSPPEDIHALDIGGLLDRSVTLFGFREDGVLLGIGGLKELGGDHGEIKSMHTLAEARGRGIGGALVDHIVMTARAHGLGRLSLETGSMAAFAPAWSIYEARGFVPCGPFGEYAASPNSRFLTHAL